MWEAAVPEGLLFVVYHHRGNLITTNQTPCAPVGLTAQATLGGHHPASANPPTWSWSSISLGHSASVSFAEVLNAQGRDGRNWHRSKDFCLVRYRVSPSTTSNPFGWATDTQLMVRGLLGDCSKLIGRLHTDESHTFGRRPQGAMFFNGQRFEIDHLGGNSGQKIFYLDIGEARREGSSIFIPPSSTCFGLVVQEIPAVGSC